MPIPRVLEGRPGRHQPLGGSGVKDRRPKATRLRPPSFSAHAESLLPCPVASSRNLDEVNWSNGFLGQFKPGAGRVQGEYYDGLKTVDRDQCGLPSGQEGLAGVQLSCAGYYDALIKIGAVPLVIPPLTDVNDLSRVLDLLDGVVLVGAAGDLDPRRDGFMLHGSVRLLDPRREDFDRTLMSLIARDGCPCSASVWECSS